MEANIQNIAHPISNHLNPQVPPVPEQAQPAPIAQPAGSQPAPLPALNQAGSLAGLSAPAPIGLSSRQVQQGYSSFDQCKSQARQFLKKGKIIEASEIYISLMENPELTLKKRLNCAKILLEINASTAQRAKAVHLLLEIAKDDRAQGPSRLKALQSLADSKGLEEKALEAFSALLQSQLLPEWIRDAAGGCVAPILLAKAQDLQLWPLERIQAAKQLAQINGQAEKAAELLIAIAQDNRYHSVYRKKAAKLVSKLDKLQGQEAQKRGKELLKAIKLEDLVKKSLSKDKKQANRSYAADYLSGRCYAAEKLSSLPGQEAEASAAWTAIVNDTKPDPEKDTIRLSYDIRLSYCIKAAERLAEIKGTEHKALAVNVLEGIKNDATLQLSYRTQAAETLSRITQGNELVDFLFELVQDVKVLSFDRIEAAERLSKLVGEDRQGEIWSAFLQHNLGYVDVDNSMKIAKRLSKIPGYEAIAADWLIRMGRHARCGYVPWNIQALKYLSRIPGYEHTAAELLMDILPKVTRNTYDNTDYLNRLQIAEALSAIPGYEEAAAALWLSIATGPMHSVPLAHAAQTLSRMPGQENKTREAWNSILTHKNTHPSQQLIYKTLAATALLELFGEKEEAIKTFIECAENVTETPDRRMLAVENLARIPGQEAKVEELKKKLKEAEEAIANQIEAAKTLLQNPGEKEKAAQALLAIAKNVAVCFNQRILAIDTLLEIPEQHPKAIDALKFISGYKAENGRFITGDSTLYQYHWLLAAEKLSQIPGQEENARIAADSYVYKLSDESRFFKW